MALIDAIRILNSLKRRKIIRDYALIGAVAATAYMEAISTEDLDIIVLVDSDEEYLATFQKIRQFSKGLSGMHYIIGEVPVQIFPTTVKPLYRDTLEKATTLNIQNLSVKVASPEHLILLFLESFRSKDKFRIINLIEKIDTNRLNKLLGEFDDEEGKLASRLETLRRISL